MSESSLRRMCLCALSLLMLALFPAADASSTVVFETDFESGMPPEITAPGAAIEPVQGWAGLGNGDYQFGGGFLRYSDPDILDTELTLTDLPAHDTVSIRMLLAVIDSWDGTELLEIRVDGDLVFSHWFQLASGDTSSYDAPPGGLLSSGTNLGYNPGTTWHSHDRAYDLSVDDVFLDIPHTASSLTVTWSLSATEGSAAKNWQGGLDESWAIDGLIVEVGQTTVSTPASARTESWSRVKNGYRD